MKLSQIKKVVVSVCILLMCNSMLLGASSVEEKEEKLEETKGQISGLVERKSGLETKLGDLNTQLSEMSASLDVLESQVFDKEEQITTTREKLIEAQFKEQEQFKDMKKRIRFMYEKGNSSYLEMIFSSESLAEAFSNVEYVMKMNGYDREMLANYQNTKNIVAGIEASLVSELDELVTLQIQLEEEKTATTVLVESVMGKISFSAQELAMAEQRALEYEVEIEKQKEEEAEAERKLAAEIAAQKAAEEEALRQQALKDQANQNQNTNQGTKPNEPITPPDVGQATNASDLELMAAIIQCEAGSESYEGKIAVGSVVMNRVRSSRFPNTVLGVIYQSGQFTPVGSGRFAITLAKGANSECRAAAGEVLAGTTSLDCLFFRTHRDVLTDGIIIGNHIFY